MNLAENINYLYSKILNLYSTHTREPYGRPTSVILIITNRCNARCVHCHSWKLAENCNELTGEQWFRAIEELRSWLGPTYLSITGGETLLKKNAISIARYAAESGFWVEFLTNGFLMNETRVSEIVRSGVKRVKISLDGNRKEIHDKIRGRAGFFKQAISALKLLVKYNKEEKSKIEIYGKTTIMKNNVWNLSEIVHIAKELGILGIEFQAIEPIYYSTQLGNSDWYKDNPLWISDSNNAILSINKLIKLKEKGYPVINSIENLEMIKQYFIDPENYSDKVHSHDYSKQNKGCSAWVSGLQITSDGGMKMCHWMESFSNVKDGNLKIMWKNRKRCWEENCRYNK